MLPASWHDGGTTTTVVECSIQVARLAEHLMTGSWRLTYKQCEHSIEVLQCSWRLWGGNEWYTQWGSGWKCKIGTSLSVISNFRCSFQLKAATSRFITLSVDFSHLQYFHNVIIVHVMLYISIYLLVNYTDAHSGKISWWRRVPKVYEQYISFAKCHIITLVTLKNVKS